MNKEKLHRRLKHLTGKYCYTPIKPLKDNLISLKEYKIFPLHYKEKLEIVTLFEQLEITDEREIEMLWITNWLLQSKKQAPYNLKPVRERKDNKDTLNESRRGGYRSNANKIRFPKKCRKTAWKRFYKLFPHLNEKE